MIACLICGKKMKAIGWRHLRLHNIDHFEYKRRFGLNRNRGLLSEETKQAQSQRQKINNNLGSYIGKKGVKPPGPCPCIRKKKRREARETQSEVNIKNNQAKYFKRFTGPTRTKESRSESCKRTKPWQYSGKGGKPKPKIEEPI